MTAIATAPATTTPLKDEPTVGQEITLVRGDYKGKDGIVVGEYNGRSYPIEITVKGESRVVNATPGSIGPRAAAEEPAAEEADEALEIDFSEATVEMITEAPVEAEPKKSRRLVKIDPDATEVEQPERIETGDHEFNDEAKGIYPTPRHLGRGYIYRYNLGWRWHNTHDEAPALEDRSETFNIGYNDRMNRMKKWHGTWFGADLDDEGDDA